MRNKIITELFNSAEFKSCIAMMRPESLQDDLKSEVAMILCEMPEDKLTGLHERGELRFYTVRVILNQIQSSTSPFYRKFRNKVSDQAVADVIDEQIDHEAICQREQLVTSALDSLGWYERELVKLYIELGSYRKIEHETGIPFESIYKTVQRAFAQIKKQVA